MTTDILDQISNAFANSVAAAAPCIASIATGRRRISGIMWRPGIVVTSEQMLPDAKEFPVHHAGTEHVAQVAGRDPGTNVALLRLPQPIEATLPAAAPTPRVGALALLLGADESGGATGRLAMVHAVGPEWHSQAGGRIEALLRLDGRLGADEGGAVLDTAGRLIGMSTSGPRRRTLVIPAATIARVIDPLLAEGRIARGWLGVGLQPVAVPDSLRETAGRESGMMVVSLASGGPAEHAGVLPGDILLDMDGTPVRRMRALAAAMGPERIGQTVSLRLLRAGALQTVALVIAARPGGMNQPGLRVALRAVDPVRRRGLAVMLEDAGHVVTDDAPDVVLCDLRSGVAPPGEAEAPVLALADAAPADQFAGVVPRAVEAPQLDAALRAVAAGLIVRAPGVLPEEGFHPADDTPALTPREVEILALVGRGFTNKAVARALGISVHTVKFHLEALFAKLEANSRAEAVAKGLRGGVIEL